MNSFFRWAKTLRFKQLFLLTLLLFIVDMVVIDPLPFVEEALLGLLTLLLGSIHKRVEDKEGRKTLD